MTDFSSCGSFSPSRCLPFFFVSHTFSVGFCIQTSARVFPGPPCPSTLSPLHPPHPILRNTQHPCGRSESVLPSSPLWPPPHPPAQEVTKRWHVLTEVTGRLEWDQYLVFRGTPQGRLSSHCVQLWGHLQPWQMFHSQPPPQDKLRRQTHRWTSSPCLQDRPLTPDKLNWTDNVNLQGYDIVIEMRLFKW